MKAFLALSLTLLSGLAQASEETQLIGLINHYRSQPQACDGGVSQELPALNADSRLVLPAIGAVDLQESMARKGYPMVNVQSVTLSGPRDAASALKVLKESFCKVFLDPQYVDIGVSRFDREWRILVARPLLASRLGEWHAEGQKLLEAINKARGTARQCGSAEMLPAAGPLSWNETLASTAEAHSRYMANHNVFSHIDADGRTPGDRVEIAGYSGQGVGENIAAGQDTAAKVVDGWLSSPGHCTTLMRAQYKDFGAAYASDPKSDAGIYWTAVFGAP
ncbi:CAP domain-containing protein [Ectopseudomonas mendocina]|uniref:CAP domain-containing protein n=1 Tax=Ectopseudomonas mendocina TaxID=300 RepID=A0ABZ2RLT4_ECTME